MRSRDVSICNYSELEVASDSLVLSVTVPTGFPSHCLLLLSSFAALHPDVVHISTSHGVYSQDTSALAVNERSSPPPVKEGVVSTEAVFVESAVSPTDQNAWVQSGNSYDQPYSQIGLDGTGYTLGLIDTGLDDMSCFFIDPSYTATPRTSSTKLLQGFPVTDNWRRKVVQYIAWADTHPDVRYDHGTWCAGAAAGACLDKTPTRVRFNGLAPAAKVAMFDVEYKHDANWLDVPSLYDIALPPSYEHAGARVHSNSWGTYELASYTSKALDIDAYMADHPDFIFIVAAGNSGTSGFSSVASPGVTKNGLTVGASDRAHTGLAYFSATGPTYDGRIKPDVVVPGLALISATGRNSTEKGYNCNAAYSSGTSMATPIVSGIALLIKQYLENGSYWGRWCNSTYRACPKVTSRKNGHVAGTLLKAALLHGGQPLKQTDKGSTAPDVEQGWGQVLMTNILPIPGVCDFDLYVADSETLQSLTQRTYTVVVTGDVVVSNCSVANALKVTIAWNDPLNVYWAGKNLLNDLDLTITSPSGTMYHGNGILGDEYNPVERIVITDPEPGAYKVQVTAKELVGTGQQAYSIVITSIGYMDELSLVTSTVTTNQLWREASSQQCMNSGGMPVRFQLEDWKGGASWNGVQLTFAELINPDVRLQSCTFPSNANNNIAYYSRTYQCDVCLSKNNIYVAALQTPHGRNVSIDAEAIRVSAPLCDVYLSYWQPTATINLSEGACNACNSSRMNTLLEVMMYANVTDDDVEDYSWHGHAFWNISGRTNFAHAASTLLISDETAERYCLPNGVYNIQLWDKELFAEIQKHALIRLPQCRLKLSGAWGSAATISLENGVCTVLASAKASLDTWTQSSATNTISQELIIGLSLLGVALGLGLVTYLFSLVCSFRNKGQGETSFVEICTSRGDDDEDVGVFTRSPMLDAN